MALTATDLSASTLKLEPDLVALLVAADPPAGTDLVLFEGSLLLLLALSATARSIVSWAWLKAIEACQ